MRKKSRVRLKREVYLILGCVLLLALVVQITHSQYVLQHRENKSDVDRIRSWQKIAVSATQVPSGPSYCFVYDPEDTVSVNIRNQAEQTFRYLKKPLKITALERETLTTEGCESIIVASHKIGKVINPDELASYVEMGGHVFFAQQVELDDDFYRLYRKMGIVDIGEYGESYGVELTSNVLIGEKGARFDDPFIEEVHVTFALEDDSKLLAKMINGTPLLWEHEYGRGSFMVCNGILLQEKMNRGLFIGAISLLVPDFIYPVFNSKVMFIDDFPAPIRQGIEPQIYREYQRDIPSFFKDIWWSDMLKAARQHDLKYTAMFIQTYNDRVKPPFSKPDDEDRIGMVSFGREVIKSGGEIGMHGYNHQSLQTDKQTASKFGYESWSDSVPMELALKEAKRFFKDSFPNYEILSYVPPSNVLSSDGREALKRTFPDLATISSLYIEDANKSAYIQEFQLASDGILEMPRLTSGYTDSVWGHWIEANGMTGHGYYSHFIHPDDLLDSARSLNMNWGKLYDQFTQMITRVDQTYPWLRPMTSTESAIDMVNVLTSSIEWERENNGTLQGKIEPYETEAYFVLRTERRFQKLHGCEVLKIDENTYLVTASQAEFSIKLGD